MNQDDAQLVQRFQDGDAEAFGLLYDAYAKKIYDFVYYRTHHRETAEDLVSDIFMKALAAVPSFNAEKGTFGAWLYRIARNRVIDHYRTDKSGRSVDIEDLWDLLASGEDVARDVEARERLAAAEKLIAKLPAAQREIVVMRAWDQLSYAEIAEITGKSEAAAKMTFSRAVATLRLNAPIALVLAVLLNPMR